MCAGQRIGIFAGSGVGKSSLLAMLARAPDFDTVVIALVGERGREVREFLDDTLGDNRASAIAVVSTGDESPMMRRLAPKTAMTVAEYFRDRGDSVLLIVDSVTRFAHAARDVALAAGEPAVARGYAPSVFSDLPRLLERAGPGDDGSGSITGVFSVLVDGDDHNDPVADNIRGTLDGHIVLDRAIADQGRYPAVNILSSISRLAAAALDAGAARAGDAPARADRALRGDARTAADGRLYRRAAIRFSIRRSRPCRASTKHDAVPAVAGQPGPVHDLAITLRGSARNEESAAPAHRDESHGKSSGPAENGRACAARRPSPAPAKFVAAKLVDVLLIGSSVAAAAGSVVFAGFMLMQGDHPPDVNGMQYLGIFAQPKGATKMAPGSQLGSGPPVDMSPVGAIGASPGAAAPQAAAEPTGSYRIVSAQAGLAWLRQGAASSRFARGTTCPDWASCATSSGETAAGRSSATAARRC